MSKGKKALKVIGIIFGSLIALIIVVNIILNIVFGIQLRNKLAELKSQGKPITIAEIVPAPVPDEENAALFYNKAFALMEPEEGRQTEMNRTIREIKSYSNISQWTDEQRKVIPELIKSRDAQYICELLEEGSRKPECNFNREYEKGIDMLLPNLSSMRDASRLLCVKALLEAESGDMAKAFDTLLVGLKFSNHLKDEPILISQLVRTACDGIIIECIKNIADSKGIAPEQATLIINEFSTHKSIEPFIKSMDGERVAFGGWGFEKILNGKMLLAGIGRMNDSEYSLVEKIFSTLILPLYKPILKKDYIYYLTLMSNVRDSYNLPYYEYKISADQQIDQLPRYCILTKLLLPALGRVRRIAAEYQANIDVCRIGLALKIYKAKNGTYPETLSKLAPEFLSGISTDPFSGKSLIYSRYIGGFKLYSVGPNMQDDYGTPKAKEQNAPANKDYDIVWKSGS
ncbi:hypothetical protein KAS42_01500 [bacterium]|nr:hypothetical protein [bacterium]